MRKSKKRSWLKNSLIAIVVLLALTMAAIAIIKYDQTHFDQNTVVCSVDVSNKNIDEASELIQNEVNKEKYSFKFGNSKYNVETTSQELGIRFDDKSLAEIMKEQNRSLFNIAISANIEKRSIDSKRIYEYVESLEGIKAGNIKPQNAECVYEDGMYKFVQEENGNYIDIEEAKALALSNIENGIKEIDFSEITKVDPEITIEDLGTQEQLDEVNNFLNTSFSYTFYDGSKINLTAEDFASYVVVDENNVPSLDLDNCIQTIVKMLEKEIPNRSETLDFLTTSTDGEENRRVTMDLRSDLKPQLNVEKEKATLREEIGKSAKINREPMYISNSYYGNLRTYIEISISKQKIWLYKDGECIVDSECITGNHSRGQDTPLGIYFLDEKERNVHLIGRKPNGDIAYDSPVKYWMRFCGGVGLHDASWRTESQYNSNTYKEHGSHGCVNLREKTAAVIYQYIDKTVPIIIYDD